MQVDNLLKMSPIELAQEAADTPEETYYWFVLGCLAASLMKLGRFQEIKEATDLAYEEPATWLVSQALLQIWLAREKKRGNERKEIE